MSAAPARDEGHYRPPMEIVSGFLDRAPVLLPEMARALGLVVNMSANLPSEISGQIVRIRRPEGFRYQIDVNRLDVPARRRFTLAHEIAHFLLHREYLDDPLTDDRMYRSRLGDQMERQANRLAAQLLMPAHLVRVAWDAGDHAITRLAEVFDVSTQAVEIRLRELGIAAGIIDYPMLPGLRRA